MNTHIIIGLLTIAFSLSIKLIGEPDQIRRNYARKSTCGLSPLLYILAFASYSLWVIYGSLQRDWVVISAQALGVVTSGVILIQMWVYRASSLTNPANMQPPWDSRDDKKHGIGDASETNSVD